MTDADALAQYDTYARRVERWDGVTIRERLSRGRNGHIIDFAFTFPDARYAEPDETRYTATEASAIIWRSPGQVESWQLRLPQIPAEGNPRDVTEDALEQQLTRGADSSERVSVRLADGERSWTPHIEPRGMSPSVRSTDAVLDTIHTVWENYQAMAAPTGVVIDG